MALLGTIAASLGTSLASTAFETAGNVATSAANNKFARDAQLDIMQHQERVLNKDGLPKSLLYTSGNRTPTVSYLGKNSFQRISPQASQSTLSPNPIMFPTMRNTNARNASLREAYPRNPHANPNNNTGIRNVSSSASRV
nr:TPA_asm: hypothetical protein [Vittapili virus]